LAFSEGGWGCGMSVGGGGIHATLRGDNQDGDRIASSRNAPEG
jgi:hypothetical protein